MPASGSTASNANEQACERFATLFLGVFDPATSTMHNVNAGHAAPILVRNGQKSIERLEEGCPVLGLLRHARYSAGVIGIETSDTLVLYSDAINEATNQNDQEFGEDRICRLISDITAATPSDLCEQIMNQVAAFASGTFSRRPHSIGGTVPEGGCCPAGPTLRGDRHQGSSLTGPKRGKKA